MMLEQIRIELETAEGLPAEALAAAVTQAPALLPDVIALLRKAAEGVYLLPRQEKLLFFGLYVLAAARVTEACPAFLALLRRPEWQLEDLFGDGMVANATGLLLGFYDDDPEPLFAALEERTTAPSVRWTLFQVLARLSWEGRIPRERLVALIDRFDREESASPDDFAWMGWEDAIRFLGLKEFEPRVRRGWEAGRSPLHNQADRDWWLESLEQAVASPADPRLFVESQVVPVTDPLVSLAWLARPRPKEELDETDPADAIRLSAWELIWLGGFLTSDQVSLDTMNLEQLDGFFAALAAGPVPVPPSEFMKAIWGSEGPAYDSPEQAQFATDLLMRHWDTVVKRLDARLPHRPEIFPGPPETMGRSWAEGFAMGLDLRQDAWAPIFGHKVAGPFAWMILSLIADQYDPEAEELAPEDRAEILDTLPLNVLGISLFWRDPKALPRLRPVRSAKIGRNEPCPCGSGRKYKKCCGAGATSS